MKSTNVSRYHPVLVTLHWLLALLIIATLCWGYFVLDAPNTDPRKIANLRIHMAGGMLILTLMVIRLIVRLLTSRPPDATTGNRLLDRLAPLAHYGFYVLVILMAGTGFTTGLLAGLPAIVFGGSGDPLPQDLDDYPTLMVHGFLAVVLVAFIVVHVLAALYHQLVRKDGLLRRMSFGRRTTTT